MQISQPKQKHIRDSNTGSHTKRKVEEILDVRGRGRSTEYFIKWRGLNSSHNTWEPTSHLESSRDLLDLFRAQRIRDNIQRYQNKKNGGYEDEARGEKKDLRTALLKGPGNNRFLVPIPESLDELFSNKKRKEQMSETELIDELSDGIDLNKPVKQLSVNKDRGEDKRPNGGEYKHISGTEIERLGKRTAKVSSTTVDDGKKIGHELHNLKKLTDGTNFVTTSQINDPQKLEIIKKDISKATKVKKTALINDKFYFLLEWPDSNTEEFYSKHYFTFNEIEESNVKVILKYIKLHLVGTYI